MVKGNMNGLDVTLKCISMMLHKAILVLAEDYLWFTHKRDIKNMETVMILTKDGKFRGERRMDGKLLQCNLPYLKDWMESQSMKADEYPSSENTDQSENPTHEVEHCSENMDISQPIVETDDGDGILVQGGLNKVDVQESGCHLNVKDIKSSDNEVIVPSTNAGRSNIPYNVSDTTFDESVTTVQSLKKSVEEHASDECKSDLREVEDTVVKNGIVNAMSEKGDDESNERGSAEKENSEVTGENNLLMKPDVTESQSTMEVSTNSMSTDKSSYKESDGATSESRETNIFLQYLTDEGRNNIQYTCN